jgi:16S rRNA processing protein RimM
MSARSRRPSNPADQPRASSSPPDGEWVAVGEVVGTFGIHGELKVNPLTDFPERFERTETIYVGDKRTPHTVEGAHLHKQQVLLRLRGIADATSAERLRGARLWIPTAEITPLPADQFYLHDVIGLRVFHVDGRELGVIADVLPTGGNDIFVVRALGSDTEVLLPAVKEFVKAVDLERGVVIVDPIAGIFDDRYEEAR